MVDHSPQQPAPVALCLPAYCVHAQPLLSRLASAPRATLRRDAATGSLAARDLRLLPGAWHAH